MTRFKDRKDAAERLAKLLKHYAGKNDVVVVALPRGGVVLGRVVADALKAPLDIVVPRKIGHPDNEEYAIGALAETGEVIWNEAERKSLAPARLDPIIEKEKVEQKRRLEVYRKGMSPRDYKGKLVVIVDDGIATGLTMLAGIRSVKAYNPKKIIVAVPVAPSDTIERVRSECDEFVVLMMPMILGAIGEFYGVFQQVDDDVVINLMRAKIDNS